MDTSVNCTFDRTTCSYNNTDGQSSWSLSDTGSTGGELPMDHTSGKGEVIVGKNFINYFKNIISFMCVNFYEILYGMKICTTAQVNSNIKKMTENAFAIDD